MNINIIILLIIYLTIINCEENDCNLLYKRINNIELRLKSIENKLKHSKQNEIKENIIEYYLLYDVNPQEGFNLRRDVMLRIMLLMYDLNHKHIEKIPMHQQLYKWRLVLPPFQRMYHWSSATDLYSSQSLSIPWRRFFNISVLNKFIPIIEYDEYNEKYANIPINNVIYLRSKDFDANRKRQYGADIVSCDEISNMPWIQNITNNNLWYHYGCSYKSLLSNELICLKLFSPYSNLYQILRHIAIAHEKSNKIQFNQNFAVDLNEYEQTQKILYQQRHIYNVNNKNSPLTIMLDRAETLFWDGRFGDNLYWQARKHLEFAVTLKLEAKRFIQQIMNDNDYIGVHLRRKDFHYAHKDYVPSLDQVVKKIQQLQQQHNLLYIFIATDAPQQEYDEIAKYFNNYIFSFRFNKKFQRSQTYEDGEEAIIDQIICSYASYFIGTKHSTFTNVILQERELMKKSPASTYNSFCLNVDDQCEQPSRFPYQT